MRMLYYYLMSKLSCPSVQDRIYYLIYICITTILTIQGKVQHINA